MFANFHPGTAMRMLQPISPFGYWLTQKPRLFTWLTFPDLSNKWTERQCPYFQSGRILSKWKEERKMKSTYKMWHSNCHTSRNWAAGSRHSLSKRTLLTLVMNSLLFAGLFSQLILGEKDILNPPRSSRWYPKIRHCEVGRAPEVACWTYVIVVWKSTGERKREREVVGEAETRLAAAALDCCECAWSSNAVKQLWHWKRQGWQIELHHVQFLLGHFHWLSSQLQIIWQRVTPCKCPLPDSGVHDRGTHTYNLGHAEAQFPEQLCVSCDGVASIRSTALITYLHNKYHMYAEIITCQFFVIMWLIRRSV